MSPASFEHICIFHILDGLRDGLSHFSHPSRAAVIYARKPDSHPRICDPQDLLRGHEPMLRDFYLYSNRWRGEPAQHLELLESDEDCPVLAGTIALGARSNSMHYQMWFTDQHPDMCSVGPTKRWLEYAVGLISQNFATQDVPEPGHRGLRAPALRHPRRARLHRGRTQTAWAGWTRAYASIPSWTPSSRSRAPRRKGNGPGAAWWSWNRPSWMRSASSAASRPWSSPPWPTPSMCASCCRPWRTRAACWSRTGSGSWASPSVPCPARTWPPSSAARAAFCGSGTS